MQLFDQAPLIVAAHKQCQLVEGLLTDENLAELEALSARFAELVQRAKLFRETARLEG